MQFLGENLVEVAQSSWEQIWMMTCILHQIVKVIVVIQAAGRVIRFSTRLNQR